MGGGGGTNKKQEPSSEQTSDDAAKRGALGNFYIKTAGKVGLVEHTELEPKFEESLAELERYRLKMDGMLTAYEEVMQPNPAVTAEGRICELDGESPQEKLALALEKLAKFSEGKNKDSLKSMADTWKKMAVNEKDFQKKGTSEMEPPQFLGRHSTMRSRQFVTIDHTQMCTDREQLNNLLLTIDETRHDVKAAKTKEELEEKGAAYKKAVRQFNNTAEKMDHHVETYFDTLYMHQREVTKFHSKKLKYHTDASRILTDYLESKKKK